MAGGVGDLGSSRRSGRADGGADRRPAPPGRRITATPRTRATTRATPSLFPTKPAWTTNLDQNVYGQPVVFGGRVIAVTENDTVYALDAHDGHVLWRVHVGTPVTNVVSQVGCGNIDPLGITSTPVIDTTRNEVFVVAANQDANKVIHHQLIGLDVFTGDEMMSANVDPRRRAEPALHPAARRARARQRSRLHRLRRLRGRLRSVSRLARVASPSPAPARIAVDMTPHTGLGAIWATNGPSIDASGDVYVATGNPNAVPSSGDYGESVLKFDPTLHRLANFSGSNAVDDEDLGSSGPSLLGNNLIFEVGKQHTATC